MSRRIEKQAPELGNGTWIEADPGAHKVIEISLPTTNAWFRVPVVFMRWSWLETP